MVCTEKWQQKEKKYPEPGEVLSTCHRLHKSTNVGLRKRPPTENPLQ